MNLRFADEHDAAACLAIYAQYIDTSITFETALPSEVEFAGRIRSYGAVYPWLIAEEEGKILAYAYAHRAQERAAYDWNAELSVYVSKNAAGRGLGTRLYRALLALLKEQGVRTVRRCDHAERRKRRPAPEAGLRAAGDVSQYRLQKRPLARCGLVRKAHRLV